MNSNQFEFVGLVAGTKLWSLRLDFVAKMVSSHDATSPIVCADLYGLLVSQRKNKCNLTSFLTNKSLMQILSGLGGTKLCRRTALSAVGWQEIKCVTSEL